VLSVTANEKPSSLPLFASNPLAPMTASKDLKTIQQGIAQTVAQKVTPYLQRELAM